MIVPKIWRICMQQIEKNFYYTPLSLKNLNKKRVKTIKNKYKIVFVANYYKNKSKIVIFKDYYSEPSYLNRIIFKKLPRIHCL
tara:strand:- start:777 stop:1025 length:249 start_codon:yes stop_codon:yes gene_type:complete